MDLKDAAEKFPVGTRVENTVLTGTVIFAHEYLTERAYSSRDGMQAHDSAFRFPESDIYGSISGDVYIAVRWDESGIGSAYPESLAII